MSLHTQTSEPIILGSGELYLGTVANPDTADETTISAALVNIGAIESGASITYKPTVKDVESANRGTITKFVTKEEVSFKTGIITWVIDNLSRLAPMAITTDGSTGKKTIKIGNKGSIPVNYLRFVHTKKDNSGTITVNIYKAQNVNGFSFGFDKEKPLSIDYEFTALATSDGTLCEIVETFTSASLNLTAIIGSPSSIILTTGQSKKINVIGVIGSNYSNTVANPVGTTFVSSIPAKATVDASGNVTFVAAGSTVITITNGSLTDTVNVTCS